MWGCDRSVGRATRYGLDGRWGGGGVRFSASIQTGPRAHPASYTAGTGSIPEVVLTTHPHLAPGLKKE